MHDKQFLPVLLTVLIRGFHLERLPNVNAFLALGHAHTDASALRDADDAGATETSVHIQDGRFIFTHNGEDFIEEHFTSLCRFGYSNKRALHTIGFRGIGFKSTFSLGDTVELHTPTLSVAFERERFTEPRWIPGATHDSALTRIQLAIADERREQEAGRNLQEWLRSPVSLLFFKHIWALKIGDQQLLARPCTRFEGIEAIIVAHRLPNAPITVTLAKSV